MSSRVEFFGVYLDTFTMEESLDKISFFIETKEQVQHVVVNVAKLVSAQKDEKLKGIINSCKLINVDGAGVILGAEFLGIKIPERVAGIDLMEKLIERSAERGYKPYFLGAEEEIVKKTVEHYLTKYPNLNVAGYRNGYFKENEEEGLTKAIKESGADILFVAMGSPKKEVFLNKYSALMEVPFTMGVGGSFDVVAGKVKRAPVWVQKLNSEWLFRLLQEPGRMFRRYAVTNTAFAFMLLREFLKQKTRW
ncbi:N-acetylglucosaminyldiphosphoundecaprenol N-acetyl-beta-D-mannosaminyltransferase [Candidatus Gastranaerophilus sp. (ex Termes propinquus)]|nr:N-acetylglucosaminyldiphosphoundecaprenol N-acetyl-beta-D-mannosaminyltransferase [Candidatus Gastranaerophilus sp. (ex Termes propinquus)]